MDDTDTGLIIEWASHDEISFNPAVESLFEWRNTKDIEALRAEFETHKRSKKGAYFRGDKVLTVRRAAKGETGKYVVLEGTRRLAVCKILDLPKIPVYVDEESIPEKDLHHLLRNVKKQKWEDYSLPDIAKVVQAMVNQEHLFSYEEIRGHFDSDAMLNKNLAYSFAPQDVRDACEIEGRFDFTTVANVIDVVCEKIKGQLKYKFYDKVPQEVALTIIRNTVKVANVTNAEECALRLKNGFEKGYLELDTQGELVPTEEGWLDLNIDPEKIDDPQTIEDAIRGRMTAESNGFKIDFEFTFETNLKNALDYDWKKQITSLEQRKVLRLLDEKNCATPTEALVIQLELERCGLPQSVAEQIMLLALREYRLNRILHSLKEEIALEGQTDKEVIGKIRVEQSNLRKALLGNKETGKCALCSEEYNSTSLVAAHKKKREFCSEKERLDYNIVMPVCLFGCDHLYEKGYILIKDRKIIANPTKREGKERTNAYKLHGRILADRWWNGSEAYFQWHYEQYNNSEINQPD